MNNKTLRAKMPIDVVVVGAGPSGLAAATQLKKLGLARVIVIEREAEAGGIPRHCGHPPFGMREFTRVLTGTTYAKKLVESAQLARVEIWTLTTVVEIHPNACLTITSSRGVEEISARRVIYATGVRETPRSARLISGTRPQGVINTGALQSMVFLKNRKPFKKPVIVGTELVAFSAITTCKHAGISPVAMIEENNRATARWPSALYPVISRIPLLLNHRLVTIEGEKSVRSVTVKNKQGEQKQIECDGVILTGKFVPEASLGKCGHLEIDNGTGGPVVDEFGRCSDPTYFACGNILRPVETAGWSWKEGVETAGRVMASMENQLPEPANAFSVKVENDLIKFAVPQRISFEPAGTGMKHIQLGFKSHAKGTLSISIDGQTIWKKPINKLPARRMLVAIEKLISTTQRGDLVISFQTAV